MEITMNAKLTLKLNKSAIDQAKSYAKKTNQSLSFLVEKYFTLISEKNRSLPEDISPIVQELSGIINLADDFDYKKEYHNYIREKYS